MYALNERVNQVYFGILLLDEQLEQNTLLNEELQRNLKNVMAYRDNGIANDADVDAVQVEILNTQQQRVSLESNRVAYLRMLALLIGENLATDTRLVKPIVPQGNSSDVINRPELSLYTAQENSINVKEQALKTGYRPQLGLFAQGAYGNPGLNMLKNSFEPYYIVGARLSWNFLVMPVHLEKSTSSKFTTESTTHPKFNRDLFLFNTHLQLAEQQGVITALQNR